MKNKKLKLLIFIILALIIVIYVIRNKTNNKLKESNESAVKLLESNYTMWLGEIEADFVCKFSESRARIKRNEMYGYIDCNGNEIIPCIYDDANDFRNGIAIVKLKDKWGAINEEGVEKIPFIYDYLEYDLYGGKEIIARQGDTRFILNKDGSIINFFNKSYIGSNNMVRVRENDETNKIVNSDGKELISSEQLAKYDEFQFTFSGLLVAKNNKWGLIDKDGIETIPCIYEEIKDFLFEYSRDILLVKKDSKYGYRKSNGEEIVPCIYDNAMLYYEGFAKVCKNEKWGLIDIKGNEIAPCIYDDLYYFREGTATVKRDRKWGVIDTQGKEVIKCIYDYEVDFENGLAKVCKNEKWGYINIQGQEIIPCIYDNAYNFKNGFAVVERYGKYGYIDNKGGEVGAIVFDDLHDVFRNPEDSSITGVGREEEKYYVIRILEN